MSTLAKPTLDAASPGHSDGGLPNPTSTQTSLFLNRQKIPREICDQIYDELIDDEFRWGTRKESPDKTWRLTYFSRQTIPITGHTVPNVFPTMLAVCKQTQEENLSRMHAKLAFRVRIFDYQNANFWDESAEDLRPLSSENNFIKEPFSMRVANLFSNASIENDSKARAIEELYFSGLEDEAGEVNLNQTNAFCCFSTFVLWCFLSDFGHCFMSLCFSGAAALEYGGYRGSGALIVEDYWMERHDVRKLWGMAAELD
ncbi:hypothetical protein IWZ01DRAFT_486877 [Phyllosticta capitalensis]